MPVDSAMVGRENECSIILLVATLRVQPPWNLCVSPEYVTMLALNDRESCPLIITSLMKSFGLKAISRASEEKL
jgi:hypothetical protein